MNKNKIFNIVAKYMLVVMLALLPGASWGDSTLHSDYASNDFNSKSIVGSDNTISVSLVSYVYTKLKWASQNNEWEDSSFPDGGTLYMRMDVVNKSTNELADISSWTISYGQQYNTTNYDKANYGSGFASDYVNYYYNNNHLYFLKNTNIRKHSLDLKIEAPSGTDVSNYELQFYLSNEKPTLDANKGVTTDPTIKAKVTTELLKASDLKFTHYEGVANKTGDWQEVNGQKYQKTYEWEYHYYVDSNDDKVLLVLPLENYASGGSNDLEPRGYFRWYDYATDQTSDYLVKCSDMESKLQEKDKSGLFAYNIGTSPTSKLIGVYFDTSKMTEGWEGTTVACDVSRYIDGMDDSKTYLLHEPTLSIRYIFHIKPRKNIADDIKEALCSSTSTGDVTYEDNKKVTFGYMSESSVTSLRLNLNDVSRYSFYPMTEAGLKKNVYKKQIDASDFETDSYKNAKNVVWRVYDAGMTKYCELPSNSSSTTDVRFHALTISELNNSYSWKDLEGKNATAPTITKGSSVYVVAYLVSEDSKKCPVANFEVRFMDFHPMSKEQMEEKGVNGRMVSYLNEHYTMATKPISFDDDDEEQTLSAPTNADDNQARLPSKWNRRAYGFVYRDLVDYDAANTYLKRHSPGHGEFGLYKSANVSGISDQTSGYTWWHTGTALYDKTYEYTNGAQYGHFLYVDASDESRQIAQADFKASLCAGMQLIFSAAVADLTSAQEHPQVLFKLYGMDYDADGNVKTQKLLHSFSSGDFNNNVDDLKQGVWYQVYGKVVLQQDAGVENYSDFRIVIDNYCKGTNGADYAIDDIRIYLEPAKVQVTQDRPACGSSSTGNIKLKIRAIHETLKAITQFADEAKIYFRFVNEDGTPVVGTDESNPYYQTVQVNTDDASKNVTYKNNQYGTVNIFDSEETCKKYTIDGVPMLETDESGETFLVLSNREYPLELGKKYYVAISTKDPSTGDVNWGNPAAVCSVYSDWFQLIGQTPSITDSKGNAISEYRVSCDAASGSTVTLTGTLTTIHPTTGETVTLKDVPFYWYLDGKGDDACLNSDAASKEITLNIGNETNVSTKTISFGAHTLYLKPSGTTNEAGENVITSGGVSYLLCNGATPLPLRIAKDGPKLNFGFYDVVYLFSDGDYEASLRLGLPQIKALKEKNGYLQVPLHSTTDGSGKAIYNALTFLDDTKATATAEDGKNVYVATTNDPTFTEVMKQTKVATLRSYQLAALEAGKQSTLDMKFEDGVLDKFHEGYWYELRFVFEKRGASEASTNCPGESYLKLKIVPEYVTWYPSLGVGNANWNNDANWHRSNSAELYKSDYTNYQAYQTNASLEDAGTTVAIPTINNYVPMKFTKVTIADLQGLPFPDLGNIVTRSSNGIATKLTNVKGNVATDNIQYDIMAYWDESDTNKGLDASGDLKCEKFYGNTCHQIYFKPQAELRDQCYLVYDKAWVEKELKPNTWYTMSSPLEYIYAGDMYLPSSNGRQETEAFKAITFDATTYSRSLYPVYQRAWEKSGVEEITANGNYGASHYPDEAKTGNVDLAMGYWSHIYNKVDESYAADGTFGGFSIKAGNALLPKDKTANALLRLPKEDTSYNYYDYEKQASSNATNVTKSTGHGKFLVSYNNDESHLAPMTQSLGTGKSGFYLVANPYTCSISLKKFFEVNAGLAKQAWIVEGGVVKTIAETDFESNDYAIMPIQSFFVKKSTEGTDVSEVKFTSAMYVDRLITSGLLVASDDARPTVVVTARNNKGQVSKARICVSDEASQDYDENEDVDLFYDQNLQDIPQVYTVAGHQAVAVNAAPAISWLPLGIVLENKQQVGVTLDGIAKLSDPLYLYDAADKSYTELHDGETVNVEAGDHGRYFLTQTRGTTGIESIASETTDHLVSVYSPVAGTLVVAAANGEKLGKVEVFTIEGKRVYVSQTADRQRMTWSVPTGIYVVRATTQSSAGQLTTQKVSVR